MTLENVDSVKRLAEKLAGCDLINRLNNDGDQEAWTIAHGLSDIEESCRRLFGDLVPRILDNGNGREDIKTLLIDVAEELRHIHYHIRDSIVFREFCLDELHEDEHSDRSSRQNQNGTDNP